MGSHLPAEELASHERQLAHLVAPYHLDKACFEAQEHELILGHHVEGFHMKQMVPRMRALSLMVFLHASHLFILHLKFFNEPCVDLQEPVYLQLYLFCRLLLLFKVLADFALQVLRSASLTSCSNLALSSPNESPPSSSFCCKMVGRVSISSWID